MTTDNLEDALRTMLRERAGDVHDVPESVFAFEREQAPAPAPTHLALHRRAEVSAPRRHLLAIAAGIVAVLTLAGIVVAAQERGSDTPPAAPTPDRSTSVTPSPAPAGPRTSVSLAWFGVDAVDSYSVLSRSAEPGYRDLDWRRDGETATAQGSNGGSGRTASVTVFDAGRFPAARSGVLQGTRLVDTRDGRQVATYRAQARRVTGGKLDTVRVPTLAWQYAANAWVVVQAVTPTPSDAELARLADAVHPGVSVPITVPFRLTSAPAGTITSIVDGRPQYPLIIRFDAGAKRFTEFQVKSKAGRLIDFLGLTPTRVGGLGGYLDPANGGYVEYADGIVTVARTAGSDQLDLAGIRTIFAGLTWSGGDGSGPGVPLVTAFPR